ncbi:TPA: hypothetical protein I3529_003573 [Enterobacter asburiae]|nr:hypothetical protein [Enterobacter asburiae]
MIPLLKGSVITEPPAHARERKEVDHCCLYDARDWAKPHWAEEDPVHNWRNYAPPPLRRIWQTFTDEQKRVIAFTLQTVADAEQWD